MPDKTPMTPPRPVKGWTVTLATTGGEVSVYVAQGTAHNSYDAVVSAVNFLSGVGAYRVTSFVSLSGHFVAPLETADLIAV